MSNVAVVQGRISYVSTREGVWYHDIQTPAPDEYTPPGWVKVRAQSRLGQPGEEIKCRCSISGYRRTFQTKDGNEGSEVKMVLDFQAKEPAKVAA